MVGRDGVVRAPLGRFLQADQVRLRRLDLVRQAGGAGREVRLLDHARRVARVEDLRHDRGERRQAAGRRQRPIGGLEVRAEEQVAG
jgi:hypothetical protein